MQSTTATVLRRERAPSRRSTLTLPFRAGRNQASDQLGETGMNIATPLNLAVDTSMPAVHDARELTAGGREARIVLNGNVYTLRITRQGKLILTK